MTKTMMGWVVTALATAAVLVVPSNAQSQSSPGAVRAAELEFEASRLHGQRHQWAYAADLYLAAVQLREDGDPRAQEDLLLAANLGYETGDAAGTISALESAATRTLASGDVVRAADIFADAAWVAHKAGLRTEQRRLTHKVAELAGSSELSEAQRDQIMARFEQR